jgi:hypothetical protein
MTKKKRGPPGLEELLARPWCYYCERDFDDLKILTGHMKAKHYKCQRCGRRLNTAGGLSVHMSQVHKEQLTEVENALEGRKDVGVEVFGMEGIPQDVLDAHIQQVTHQFFKAEAEHRAKTGNSLHGGPPAGSVKRVKMETPEEIKARLAEHRARRAAEKAGLNSASNPSTPANGDAFMPPSETVGHYTHQA